MATAGSFAGRLAEVAISTTNIDPNSATFATDLTSASYSDIEKVNSPKFASTTDSAESSNNDSGGVKEFVPTWESGTLTFEMTADDSTTIVQNTIVWVQYLAKSIRGFRLRPRGNSSTDQQIFMAGIITNIEQNADKGDVSKYSVTVQKVKALARSTQP